MSLKHKPKWFQKKHNNLNYIRIEAATTAKSESIIRAHADTKQGIINDYQNNITELQG
jgi:hypothetical protein